MNFTNESITQWIVDFMSKPENNNMKELPGFAFAEPIVGFSRGNDEWYSFYKEHIGSDFYRLPSEWLAAVHGHPFDPANVSIISWFLPHTDDTKEKSRKVMRTVPDRSSLRKRDSWCRKIISTQSIISYP